MTADHIMQRRPSKRFGWRRFLAAGMIPALTLVGAAQAQEATPPQSATPVVQPLPNPDDPHAVLSSALAKLGRNPRDLEALQQAGNAALQLGDVQAATGFLSRADRLVPYNPRIMAALASARLRAQDPVTALALFEDAEKAGQMSADQVADRGLAYDLVSDNVTAQRYYRQALAGGAGDEAVRRLALSLAIMGDRRGVETALAPLLQKQDRAAWRIRAFAFAILGREEEAVSIANSTMPPDLANAMAPYLRYMRKLTPSQQAAAANLGFFPQASQIGIDNARITDWVEAHGLKRLAIAEPEPVAAPEPVKLAKNEGRNEGKRPKAKVPPPVRDEPAPPEPSPSRESSPAAPVELAAVPVSRPVSAPEPKPSRVEPTALAAAPTPGFSLAPEREPAPAVAGPQPEPAPQPALPAPEPAASELAKPSPEPAAPMPEPVKPAPEPVKAVVQTPSVPAKKPSFSELFQDFGKASTAATPAAGAVDIRKISAPRPAPKEPPKPLPPKHPSRIWVQIGVGRDVDKMPFDWRKLNREEPELFKGRKPFTSEQGRTNRLLTGPFDDEAEAKAYVAKLKKAGQEGAYMWISPEGQAVDPVGGK